MKILVIFTGGTIGSRLQNGWISPDRSTKYSLIENFEKARGNTVEFSTAEPYFLLSENLSAENLNTLISCVKEHLDAGLDGIIVTHGTDTLHYTASALRYAFGDRSLPIMLVSANFPLGDPRSNGNANFAAAVDHIAGKQGRGVYIAYKNRGEEAVIYRPDSVAAFGECDDRIFPLAVTEKTVVPTDFTLRDDPGILILTAHPGDGFSYSLDGIRAVIMRPYHSGTLNTASPFFSYFCKRAKEGQIPIFAVNAAQGSTYETSAGFSELGIIPLPLTPLHDVFIKLWIGVSLGCGLTKFVLE